MESDSLLLEIPCKLISPCILLLYHEAISSHHTLLLAARHQIKQHEDYLTPQLPIEIIPSATIKQGVQIL